jgi:hypothetical protein
MIRLAVLGSLAAVVIGCTENPSIVILRNVEPTGDCEVSPSATIAVSRGFLDVTNPLPDGSINFGYVMTPVISNPVLSTTSTASNPNNPSARIFFLQGVNVELVSASGGRSAEVIAQLAAVGLDERSLPLGSSIPPGGQAGLGFEIIDFEQVVALNQIIDSSEVVTVIARVTVFGTRDDSDIESLPFEYPVLLCRGCLILDAGECALIPTGTELPQGGICNLVQDASLSCCTDANGLDVCPAKAPM